MSILEQVNDYDILLIVDNSNTMNQIIDKKTNKTIYDEIKNAINYLYNIKINFSIIFLNYEKERILDCNKDYNIIQENLQKGAYDEYKNKNITKNINKTLLITYLSTFLFDKDLYYFTFKNAPKRKTLVIILADINHIDIDNIKNLFNTKNKSNLYKHEFYISLLGYNMESIKKKNLLELQQLSKLTLLNTFNIEKKKYINFTFDDFMTQLLLNPINKHYQKLYRSNMIIDKSKYCLFF
jgi:hypothetical protein